MNTYMIILCPHCVHSMCLCSFAFALSSNGHKVDKEYDHFMFTLSSREHQVNMDPVDFVFTLSANEHEVNSAQVATRPWEICWFGEGGFGAWGVCGLGWVVYVCLSKCVACVPVCVSV